MIDIYANTTLNYFYPVVLSNTDTWTAQSHVVTLDHLPILDTNNNDIGWLSSTLVSLANNLSISANNYLLNLTANNTQTAGFMVGTLNPNERILLLQTQFVGASGNVQQSNDIYISVKASLV